MAKKTQFCSGFSLIEILIICLIIATLIFIAVPFYGDNYEKSMGAKALETLRVIATAEGVWATDNEQYTNSIANLQTCAIFPANDGDWTYTVPALGADADGRPAFTIRATRNSGRLINYYVELEQDNTVSFFDTGDNPTQYPP
ncbi:MAG: hypothetical protein GY853_06435 [PVC group bacterium]|nr:hypothetical protein [PVC group bacterium]